MLDASKWHILLVDDEFDSAKLITTILKYYGVEVDLVNNGVECLEALKTLGPILILLDLSLPEMDGWETLKHIRSNSKSAHIPVVALTAYHSASVAEDALRAGFNAYFSKPISTKTIIKKLAELIEAHESQ